MAEVIANFRMSIADFWTGNAVQLELVAKAQLAVSNRELALLPTCGFFDCSGVSSSFLLVIARDAFGEGVSMDPDGGGSLGEMLLMSG